MTHQHDHKQEQPPLWFAILFGLGLLPAGFCQKCGAPGICTRCRLCWICCNCSRG